MTQLNKSVVCLCALFFMAGCGSEEGGETQPNLKSASEALIGIYAVDAYLRNNESCDSDGESVIDELDEIHLFLDYRLIRTPVGNFELVEIISCVDVEDCRQRHAAWSNNGEIGYRFGFTFEEASGPGRLLGLIRGTGFGGAADGMCVAPESSDLILVGDEQGISIEQLTRIGEDYPEEDGFCTVHVGQDRALGEPCAFREFMTARKVADL